MEFYEVEEALVLPCSCTTVVAISRLAALAKLLVNSILQLWCKKVAFFFMVAMKTESYMHRIQYTKAVDANS